MPTPDVASAESPAAAIASFVTETSYEDVPPAARETVRRAIVDTVGVTLAGLSHGSAAIAGEFVGVDPTAGVPHAGETGAAEAELALLFGTAAHALDYDDLSWAMDGHPSVVLLPPILALADATQPTGEAAIAAYAIGFEVACTVAEPISPGHYEAGWHATSTFGAIGAAATAASLLDLDAEATERAIDVAASTASGVKGNFGSMTKPLHAGLAARSGVTAARLAEGGFTAGARALDGGRGFWALYRGATEGEIEAPAPPTADGWRLVDRGIHVKKYPACYFTHSSIAATRSLVAEHGIDPDDVAAVRVAAAGGAGDALTYDDPATSLQSKFSMPHAVAVALVADRVGMAHFEEAGLEDGTIAALRERVDFTVDESLEYDSHAATVTIETADGEFSTVQEHPPWTHAEPPTDDELRGKFVEAAGRTVGEADAEAAFEAFAGLESTTLADALAPVRPKE